MNFREFAPKHFLWRLDDGICTITLNRPEKKNPLTFESYAELRDTFRNLVYTDDVHAVIITGAQGNFCSGGDVNEIIGPLTQMDMKGLLAFTRMTCDLVKAIVHCPQPVIAAVDGVCVGGGAAVAMASDIRMGTASAKVAFLFARVGLAGCDMGACSMLPRIIGHGRAAELFFTGRTLTSEEAERWGFFNSMHSSDALLQDAHNLAKKIIAGPTFAHGMTKTMLNQEWNMGIDQALEAEAQAQALCMQTKDFERAFKAFVAKETPIFLGD
jgi:enoyl-CoA hydratase/carnithine racemase